MSEHLSSEFLNLIRLIMPQTLVGCISLYTSQSIDVHPSHRLHKTCHFPSPITTDSAWVIVPCHHHHHVPLPHQEYKSGPALTQVQLSLRGLRTSCNKSEPRTTAVQNPMLKLSNMSHPLITHPQKSKWIVAFDSEGLHHGTSLNHL